MDYNWVRVDGNHQQELVVRASIHIDFVEPSIGPFDPTDPDFVARVLRTCELAYDRDDVKVHFEVNNVDLGDASEFMGLVMEARQRL